jgi:hypothetical protein
MTDKEIVRRRLAGVFLTSPGFSSAHDVVRTLGAVQAQDYAGAKWALAMRTTGLTDRVIEDEISSGRIVRTHVLRPTWHFASAADIRWMLALTGPRLKRLMGSYDRKLELDDAVFRRSHKAIVSALEGRKCLTRLELRMTLERARIGTVSGQRLGHLMLRAELDAVVCSGPRRGKQFTYTLLEEQLPSAPLLDRDESLLELTRRYFTTRGPATVHDFAWWSGLTIVDVRRGLELVGPELVRTETDRGSVWFLERSLPRAAPSAHLLPNYDEYFIGYKDRSAIGGRLSSAELVTGGDGLIAHVVAVDGQLVGGWKRLSEKNGLVVELNLLTRLAAAEQRRVTAQVRRLEQYLEQPVAIREKKRGGKRDR